jgi:tetratricopeptide (TPR) repeat protein
MREAVVTTAVGMALRASPELPGSDRIAQALALSAGQHDEETLARIGRQLASRTLGIDAERDLANLVEECLSLDLLAVRRRHDRIAEQVLLAEVALLFAHRGSHDLALAYLEEAQRLAADSKEPYRLAVVLGDLGLVRALSGDYSGAVEDLSRSRRIFEESGLGYGVAKTEMHLGMIALARGRLDEARAWLNRVHTGLPKKVTHQSIVLLALGKVEFASRRYAEAVKHLEAASRHATTRRNLELASAIRAELGHVQLAQGNYAAARANLKRAASQAKDNGQWELYGQALGNVSLALAYEGELLEAERVSRDVLRLCHRMGNDQAIAHAELNLAVILLEARQLGEARDLLNRSLSVFERYGQSIGAGRCLRALAHAEARLGAANALALLARGQAALPDSKLDASQLNHLRRFVAHF